MSAAGREIVPATGASGRTCSTCAGWRSSTTFMSSPATLNPTKWSLRIPDRLPSSTPLGLAGVPLSGVPVKRYPRAERSTPPPLVAPRDTHTTSTHPNPPGRVRRGPLRVHPQGPAPLGADLPAGLVAGWQAQVDRAHRQA